MSATCAFTLIFDIVSDLTSHPGRAYHQCPRKEKERKMQPGQRERERERERCDMRVRDREREEGRGKTERERERERPACAYWEEVLVFVVVFFDVGTVR